MAIDQPEAEEADQDTTGQHDQRTGNDRLVGRAADRIGTAQRRVPKLIDQFAQLFAGSAVDAFNGVVASNRIVAGGDKCIQSCAIGCAQRAVFVSERLDLTGQRCIVLTGLYEGAE